jgi:hypothetical protein
MRQPNRRTRALVAPQEPVRQWVPVRARVRAPQPELAPVPQRERVSQREEEQVPVLAAAPSTTARQLPPIAQSSIRTTSLRSSCSP